MLRGTERRRNCHCVTRADSCNLVSRREKKTASTHWLRLSEKLVPATQQIRARRLLGLVGLAGEQELHAEIAEEIGLTAAGGLEAASGHEKKDHGGTELVASAEIDGGLVLGGMEGSLGVELHVAF